jgi:hypothetical protein
VSDQTCSVKPAAIAGVHGRHTLALQEGVCDNTSFPLSHCYTSLFTLVRGEAKISPVGRNRSFFRILTSKDTMFGPFS